MDTWEWKDPNDTMERQFTNSGPISVIHRLLCTSICVIECKTCLDISASTQVALAALDTLTLHFINQPLHTPGEVNTLDERNIALYNAAFAFCCCAKTRSVLPPLGRGFPSTAEH
jgi:hypothetical protein